MNNMKLKLKDIMNEAWGSNEPSLLDNKSEKEIISILTKITSKFHQKQITGYHGLEDVEETFLDELKKIHANYTKYSHRVEIESNGNMVLKGWVEAKDGDRQSKRFDYTIIGIKISDGKYSVQTKIVKKW